MEEREGIEFGQRTNEGATSALRYKQKKIERIFFLSFISRAGQHAYAKKQKKTLVSRSLLSAIVSTRVFSFREILSNLYLFTGTYVLF